jgi:class 3 adenylate cyclase/tetratricopeptide (TPR) repeat protein
LERRLAAILAADVVGYSRLMEEGEAIALGVIRELKENHFEPRVLEHGGEILKRMGDGWIVAFTSIAAAVDCAMETQAKIAGDPVIKLRIGAHIGDIVFDTTDFHGASVNLAQRLEMEAPPGGLMVSQDFYRQLGGELAKEFTDAGSFQFKNIALPVNGFQWRPQQRAVDTRGDVPSIKVETFDFAPDDAETRATAAELRDQLIVRLSRRTGIKLFDESSGRADSSDYLLRGRLRLSPALGRLTLSLILRGEGRPIWSQTHEADASDVFRFCDDLIEKADAELRIQINAFDAERIAHLPDEALSVSELRSRAANAFYKLTIESWRYALEILDRALRLSPEDPMALAMRAEAIVTLALAHHEQVPEDEAERLGGDLDRAVEALPRSDYVFCTRGFFRIFVQNDSAGALKDAEQVLALSPAYAPGYDLLGFIQLARGDFERAVSSFDRSNSLTESDPSAPFGYFAQAAALLCGGDAERAADMVERAIQLRPNQWAYHRLHAICGRKMHDLEVAEKAEARALELPREPSILAHRLPLPADQADLSASLCPRDLDAGGQSR